MTQKAKGVAEGEVPAVAEWPNNAALIRDVAQLGYIVGRVLDVTHGPGAFWNLWQPEQLVRYDLDPAKGPDNPGGLPVDFRQLPHDPGDFDTIVFDPPYKLNGTPTAEVDGRYGVDVYRSRTDRHALMVAGLVECARLLPEYLLVKCQDQVNGGMVRWQTDLMTDTARDCGYRKKDRFDIIGGRPQDPERGQEHARHNCSTLLIFTPERRRVPSPA